MDKCERWNKIAPLQHKGCNFIVPQALTYTAIVLLVLYFIAFNYRAIFDISAEQKWGTRAEGVHQKLLYS